MRAGEPFAPLPDPGSLTVATYNVHGLRDAAGVKRDLAALDEVLLWCLQEVPYVGQGDIDLILPPGSWHVAIIPVNHDAKTRQWEAQVIASRFPMDGVEVWPLDEGGAKRRVALAALMKIDGRRVLVANTDHEPSFLAWRDGNAVQTRRLAGCLSECDEEIVIVAGDFNCSGNLFCLRSNAAHVRQVDDALGRVGFTPLATKGSTFRSGLVRARLDRVYSRGATPVAGAIATTSRGSDHLPVSARFTLIAPSFESTRDGR